MEVWQNAVVTNRIRGENETIFCSPTSSWCLKKMKMKIMSFFISINYLGQDRISKDFHLGF